MKTLLRIGVIVCLILATKTFGQTAGDFQTHQTGNWNDVNSWERWDGATWVNPAPSTPDSSAGKVSILSSHTITVTTNIIVDSVFVNTGGTLVVNAGDTVTVGPPGQSGISVSGTMIVNGIYKHARNGGSIPIATWNTGSTCLITGATASTPSNSAQSFYNFTWNCPGQSSNLNVGWQNGTIISGTLTVTNSNWNHASNTSPANQFRLFGGAGSCTLNNIVVNGYNAVLTPQGSSLIDTVTVNGDITLSAGGMLSMANNSSAVTTYFVKGNFTVIDSAYIAKSATANVSKFVFCKSGTQNFTLPSSGVTLVSAPNIVDSTGSTLNMGTSVFSGAGSFQVQSGATLWSGHVNGINGNITCTGANGGGNSFSPGASYAFNGASAQVTGSLLPSTVNNLTINNSAGVTLLNTDTVAGTLVLTSGVLKIGSKNVVSNLVSGGSVSSYVVTDSSGTLTVNGVGSTQTIFPVGISAGYAPLWITNTGAVDTFTVAAAADTLGGTKNGGGRVRQKWSVAEKTPGGSNASLQFGWIGSNEDAIFAANRSGNAKIFRLSDTTQAGSGSYTSQLVTPPYTLSRGGIATFGVFAVGNFSGFVSGDGDYRSHQTGPWSNVNTWERNNGATWISPAPSAPTYTDSVITIQSGHIVNVSDSVNADQITVASGGTLKVDSAKTLVIANGNGTDLIVLGSLVNAGIVTLASGSTLIVSGGTYEHAQNGGTIPAATWNTGSLCRITGTTAATSFTGGGGQNFYNVEWNCPNQTVNTSMGLNGATISGNFKVVSTNTGRVHFFGSSSSTVTINGDVIVQGGNFAVQGTSSVSSDTVKHFGNISVTGGNFSISRGSQGGSGITLWYVNNGNVSIANATTQNSTTTTSGGFAKFVFAKAGSQTLALSSVTYGGGGMPIEVSNGTTLSIGTSLLGGNGIFTLNSGATLESGGLYGLDSVLATTGTKSLSKSANYIFTGTTAQVTGILLPDSVNNLTINDTAGVRLSNGVTVNGALTLSAGKLFLGSKNLAAASISGASSTKYIVTDSAGTLKQYAVGATQKLFPVGTTVGYSPVWITNAGTVDTFTVAVSNDALGGTRSGNGRVKLKWDINEKTAGGSNATLQFGWNAFQEDANFTANRAGNALIVHLPDTLHVGTGAYTSQFTTQPYTLSRAGITTLGSFAVGRLGSITSVGGTRPVTPKEFSLEQNYPNPFNPSTVIYYQLPKESRVSLKIYSMLGQEVATLVDEAKQAGSYTVTFSAQSGFASGVYFYRIQAGDFIAVKKMMLVK